MNASPSLTVIHGVAGVGKTWVLCWLVAEALKVDKSVAFVSLDVQDGAIVERLGRLGAPLARCHFFPAAMLPWSGPPAEGGGGWPDLLVIDEGWSARSRARLADGWRRRCDLLFSNQIRRTVGIERLPDEDVTGVVTPMAGGFVLSQFTDSPERIESPVERRLLFAPNGELVLSPRT